MYIVYSTNDTRAYSRHCRYGCIFWGTFFAKNTFCLFDPLKKSFLIIPDEFFFFFSKPRAPDWVQ